MTNKNKFYKNGFIAVSIIYSLFFVFLLLMILIMANYSNNRIRLTIYKDDIKVQHSAIDIVGPTCSVTFTLQNENGISGTISATDANSPVVEPSSFTFSNLKETTQYSFKDDYGNETKCNIVANIVSSYRTRTKTLNNCKTTHEECRGGYYDPYNCKGSCKSTSYNSCAASACGCALYNSCRTSSCGCSLYAKCPSGYTYFGTRGPSCGNAGHVYVGVGCETYNSCRASACGCASYNSCATSACGSYCSSYYYNAPCGNIAYNNCLTKENVCDAGYDYGAWSDYAIGDCNGQEQDVCEVSSSYTGSLEELA